MVRGGQHTTGKEIGRGPGLVKEDPLTALAKKVGLSGEEVKAFVTLVLKLLSDGSLSYEEVVSLAGEEEALEAMLVACELGLAVPSRPEARCLEWDAAPLSPGSKIVVNRAAEVVLRAVLNGRDVLEALSELMAELGLSEPKAREVAALAIELAGREYVTGAEVALACRSHGLSGLESQVIAILKAAGAISPTLSTSWPSGDVRYRTCRALMLLAGPSATKP